MGFGNRWRVRPVVLAAVTVCALLAPWSVAEAAPPAMAITKTADSPSVNARDQIGYRIVVSNTGRAPANAVITDRLPANTGTLWSISPAVAGCAISSGTLNCVARIAGGATFQVHIVSPTDQRTCGNVTNQASVSSTAGSATSQIATIAVNCPSLYGTLAPDQGHVNAGDPVGYSIIAGNNGPGVAYGFTMTDGLPSGVALPGWQIDSISPGFNCSFIANTPQILRCVPMNGDLPPGGQMVVHVSAASTSANCPEIDNAFDLNATNGIATTIGPTPIAVTCAPPDLVISSIQFTAPTGYPADSYTVTVQNIGQGPADLSGVPVQGYYATSAGTWPTNDGACGAAFNQGTTLAAGASVDLPVGCSSSAPPGDTWLVAKVNFDNHIAESDTTNNVTSVPLYTATLTDDGSCTLTVTGTWHNAPVDQVTGQWYADTFTGPAVFTTDTSSAGPNGGTISGNTATMQVGPLSSTSDSHTWMVLVQFYGNGAQFASLWSNADTVNCR